MLVASDLNRAGVIACLPLVDQVWQVCRRIFALQAVLAGFAPAFAAVIPDGLTAEGDETKALCPPRLTEDLEQIAAPALATLRLTVVRFSVQFAGLVGLELLVVTAQQPVWEQARRGGFERM